MPSMSSYDSNKRLKSSSGAPIKTQHQHNSPAANLPAYVPPAAIGARGGTRYVIPFYCNPLLPGGMPDGTRSCKATCEGCKAEAFRSHAISLRYAGAESFMGLGRGEARGAVIGLESLSAIP